MLDFIAGVAVGLLVGGFAGVFVMALAVVSGQQKRPYDAPRKKLDENYPKTSE